MRDAECREFLDWALPRLAFRRAGFRRVRGQVCKRIARRMRVLDLPDLEAYRRRLEANRNEWLELDSLCRITVSRFCRDRPVFDWLERTGLPDLAGKALARSQNLLRCWSAGCGSGEEPYTLRIVWDLGLANRFPSLSLDIVATDADPVMLARARRGVYRAGSLRELPQCRTAEAFSVTGDNYRLRARFRDGIRFLRQDIRRQMPAGPFDLVLCRNLAFTYFEEAGQRSVLERIARRMIADGILVIGRNEMIPGNTANYRAEADVPGVYSLHRNGGVRREQRAEI